MTRGFREEREEDGEPRTLDSSPAATHSFSGIFLQVSENQEFSSDDCCRPNDEAQNSQQMPQQCSVFPLQNKNQPKCA